MMPGGVVAELEIAIPQFRYVARAREWFDAAPIPNRRDRHLQPLMCRNLTIFAADPGSRCNQQKSPALSGRHFNGGTGA
jgi:hypothetical protein